MDKRSVAYCLKHQGVPVVVLSSLEDADFGIKAVHEGAQDYISKSWLDGELLFRRCAMRLNEKPPKKNCAKPIMPRMNS